MNKSRIINKLIACFSSLIALIISLCGCKRTLSTYDRVFFDFFGTSVYVEINTSADFFWEKDKLEDCFNSVENRLSEISLAFSVSDESSFVYKFNNAKCGDSIEVSEEFIEVFEVAMVVHEKTNGLFNPTVKLLTDLWGFSENYQSPTYSPTFPFDRARNADGSFNLPEEKYVAAFKELTNFTSIKLDGLTLTKTQQHVNVDGVSYEQQLDLSCLVKGYAADEISKIIKDFGYKSFYVSLGSSSMYLSETVEGKNYEVGLTNPNAPDAPSIDYIEVFHGGLATSGVYQNCYKLDGQNYHHIIDPRTGYPSNTDVLMATVWYDNDELTALEMDALSTALVVMGADKAKDFAKNNSLKLALVTKDGVEKC